MFESCYYNSDECDGAMWHCRTCGEWFCETHQHSTDKGTNVECVSCERERKKDETKMVSFDFGIDSLVSVKAPKNTDPDTLLDEALDALRQKVQDKEIDFEFLHTWSEKTD